jgi:hypothetical protein
VRPWTQSPAFLKKLITDAPQNNLNGISVLYYLWNIFSSSLIGSPVISLALLPKG